VSETFGPLTSPYYQIRLPPPPHPYPTFESLAAGTKLFYPTNPKYRQFVNMVAVRDPRFKGSDASNLHDEEIGEDEMEWSDDEMEAEAKKRRKQKRSGSTASRGGKQNAAIPVRAVHGLPVRPHFDFQPSEETYAGSETGSMYGDEEERSVYGSEAGSSTSVARRPVSYDDLENGEMSARQGSGSQRGWSRWWR
jgi:H/ACA ribonucleoprotein complex non-core subunit NAF1